MSTAALRTASECARADARRPPQERALSAEHWLPLGRAAEAALCGGRAVNLSRLVNAGYSVPDAVVITVPALDDYLHAAGLDGEIALLEKQAGEDCDGLQALEQSVRSCSRTRPCRAKRASCWRACALR